MQNQYAGYRGTANSNDDNGNNNLCARLIVGLSYLLVVLTFPLSIIFCIKVVQEYERAVSVNT